MSPKLGAECNCRPPKLGILVSVSWFFLCGTSDDVNYTKKKQRECQAGNVHARSYRTTGWLTMKCQRRGQSNHPSKSPWHMPSLSAVDSLVLFPEAFLSPRGQKEDAHFNATIHGCPRTGFITSGSRYYLAPTWVEHKGKAPLTQANWKKKEVYKLRMAFKYVSMPQEPVAIKRDTHRTVSVLTQWSSPSMQHHRGEWQYSIWFPSCVCCLHDK